jgi:hypothetical protein
MPPETEPSPAPPEQVHPIINPANSTKKPDLGLLSLFVGIFLGGFLELLAMNHVEINWIWSALAYIILIVGFVWTFLSHGVPHRGKSAKGFGTLAIIIVFGFFAGFGVCKQYAFQHSPQPLPPINPQLSAALDALRTNHSDPALTLLGVQKAEFIQEGKDLDKAHGLENVTGFSLDAIKGEIKYKQDSQNNQSNQAWIQQQIDARNWAINKPKRDKELEIEYKRNEQATLRDQVTLSKPSLEFFNYAVSKLVKNARRYF